MPHNLFEENTYKYILTGINVASRYKVARPLRTKKSSEVPFVLEGIYKKGGVFKYPKIFQCDNGSEFKNEVKKLVEKHSVEIRRATTKYKHTQAYTELPMTGMNLKDAVKLDTVPLDTTYPEETMLPEDGLYIDIFINPANNMEKKKDEQQISFGVKIRID